MDATFGDQLLASGPIYAFASPGTLVGTWDVTATLVPQPVPEPATLTLVGLGATFLAYRYRKRRHQSGVEALRGGRNSAAAAFY